MSESLSVDEGWEEPLDSEQVTHVKGEVTVGVAAAGEWLVNVSDQVIVPMTTTEVVEALRSRRVTDRSLVWRAGMQDWTPLGDVPQLRLAAGPLAAPPRAVAAPLERVVPPTAERTLHPPPKAPARAAREERRRNTLPFGFPVVRDPATIREPAGLHAAPTAAAPESPRPRRAEVEALAIYERATPSLTFSDSVRAEWQGTTNLVHQPAPPAPPPVIARPAHSPKSEPEPKPRLSLEPQSDPKPRLSLEPQSDPKPRLSLEPQSDPQQNRPPQPAFKVSGSQPPSSLAPTTSEPEHDMPARGAGLWGDLSVVLASDLRAVQASSKRVTLIACLGSAALASLLTLWFAHSSTRHAPEAPSIAAAQPAPAPTLLKTEAAAAPSVVVTPAALPAPSAVLPTAHSVPAPSGPAVPAHAAVKPALATPPVVARPKQIVRPAPESDAPSVAADTNPYADPSEHSQPKTPMAAFKETNASAPSAEGTTPKAPNVPSGLEDSADPVHPAATAAPGF